jgi:CheY-like chemotaxis protein
VILSSAAVLTYEAVMQGKGVAAPDPDPSSINMVSLARLHVLIADGDAERRGEIAVLTRSLGVQNVVLADTPAGLFEALRSRAYDVLLCSESLGDAGGVEVLRTVRKLAPATRSVLMRTNERAGSVPEDVDALELPLSHAILEGLLQRTAEPHGGLWCEVPELSLTDILQMYHQAQRSITVLLSGPIGGRIRLESGEIVDAEAGNLHGMPAISRLLEAESGLLRTEAARGVITPTISAPFQSVLLEAAHKLDERRRDFAEGIGPTSVSSSVLRPEIMPPLRAHAPDPDSFLVPPDRRRQRAWLALASVLASVGFAAGAAFYLTTQLQENEPRAEALGDDAAAVEQSARALTPPPDVPGAKSAPQADVVAGETAPARSAASAAVAAAPVAPARVGPAPSAASRGAARAARGSFELRVTSRPSHAAVTEAGRGLGRTPLTLTIDAASVARAPREFIVRLPGYTPARLVQSASAADVESMVLLTPRLPNASSPDDEQVDGEQDPSENNSRNKRIDLDIRMRR